MTPDFAGARWWKFDFHTHTPFSKDTPWHKDLGTAQELTPNQWLLRWMAAGVDCVAVTDHNGAGWVDKLKAAYAAMKAQRVPEFRELTLFPGVELSVNGGIHLLVIFAPDASQREVEALISKVEVPGVPGDPMERTKKAIAEVLDLVAASGALAIPAHADEANGLLLVQDIGTMRQALRSEHILAMEVVNSACSKPQVYVDEKVGWVEVIGSDNHGRPNDKKPGERFTWVKMGAPSLEGLRLALLDASPLSVLRSDTASRDPNETPGIYVDRVVIRDARYAGNGKPMEVRFSPWLSALIGGRGSGKSTVLQVIRLALHLESKLPKDLLQDFEAFRKVESGRNSPGAIRDKTQIELQFIKTGVLRRVCWRGDRDIVLEELDQQSQWKELTRDLRAIMTSLPVRLLSQKQVFAIASQPAGLMDLVDKSEDVGFQAWEQKRTELEAKFLRIRADRREVEARLADRARLERDLADVTRQILVFEQQDQQQVLRNFQRTRQQRQLIEQMTKDLVATTVKVHEVVESLQPAHIRLDLFDEADTAEKGLLDLLQKANDGYLQQLGNVRQSVQQLGNLANNWDGEIERSAWAEREKEAATAYANLVERLQKEGVSDPGAYRTLVAQRQTIEQKLQVLNELSARAQDLDEESDGLRCDLETHRRSITEQRSKFLASALAHNKYVQIEVVALHEDPEAVEDGFRASLGLRPDHLLRDILQEGHGVLADLYKNLPRDDSARTEELLTRVRTLKQKFTTAAAGGDIEGWTKWIHNHLRGVNPEQLDRLQCWWPEDSLKVQYRSGSRFEPIEKGSPGQKSAAILAFLLSHGQEPIVLDQPEDDLDNQLIYDLVVEQLRASKVRRQVIVATHNANIVVNGDAEQVNVMAHRGGQCLVDESGCLQERGIRNRVCEVMEGGEKAFKQRYRRIVQEVKRG